MCECLERLPDVPDVPARRKLATAIELVSCIAAGLGRPEDQRAAAPATGRGALEALLQVIDVLQVCGARVRQHPCFDGFHDPRHLGLSEDHLTLALDVGDVPARQDVWRQLRPQAAIAPKYHDGMHPLGRDPSQV